MKPLHELLINWQENLDQNEWYFSESFDEITAHMTSEDAFQYIPVVIKEWNKMTNPFLIGEMVDFLHSVYEIANTTEVHPVLIQEKENIEALIHTYGDEYSKEAFSEFKRSLRWD
ncbi:ABC transporter [Rossellomorea sp. AcN35-11]|nr:ABC transporter [Rossellomorea aquimaris]WJV29846.1 ABC transporter [Rossellomorea sp. AcN35-11]